jgi:hypothetical protein
MAGVGQSDLPVVSAGAQATPLVTPADPNILGSNAVSNLVDAFRQGFITQDDIVSRIGDVAQAKNKALLQELGEYVSPEAITARHEALSAETAKSKLVEAASKSQTGLNPQQTKLAELQLGTQIGSAQTYGGTDYYHQLGSLYNMPPKLTKPDGTEDYEAEGRAGHILAQLHMHQMFGIPDTSIPPIEEKQADSSVKKTYFSKTPYGNYPITEESARAAQSAIPKLAAMLEEIKSGQSKPQVSVSPAGAPEATSGTATPESDDDYKIADLVKWGSIDPKVIPWMKEDPSRIREMWQHAISRGEEPAPRPTPKVASSAPSPGLFGGSSALTGSVTTSAPQHDEIRKELNADSRYKLWSDATSGIDQVHNLVDIIRNADKQDDPKSVQSRLDAERGLVYAISQLENNQPFSQIPRGVLRDWEEIIPKVPKTPIENSLVAKFGQLTGKRPLNEDQVNALITLGEQSIMSKASPAIAPLRRAKGRGLPLDEDEQALLNTNGASELHGLRAKRTRDEVAKSSGKAVLPAGIQQVGPAVDIPGKGKVAHFSDGSYRPVP